MRPWMALAAALALSLPACSSSGSGGSGGGPGGSSSGQLEGLLRVAPGECSSAEPAGSWFRMIQPGGTAEAGPYVDNVDSTCSSKSITALEAGTDGGLRVGSYQEQPDPPFEADGSSRSVAIIKPQRFFAIGFGVSTNPTDPQSKQKTPAPALNARDGKLTGNLSALDVSWNGQHFNQGAPKPGGGGKEATGTYDENSGDYTLEWTSAIVGGPFDGFSGFWHLAGKFEAAK